MRDTQDMRDTKWIPCIELAERDYIWNKNLSIDFSEKEPVRKRFCICRQQSLQRFSKLFYSKVHCSKNSNIASNIVGRL